jgi:Tfp pilus assembly protein PilW
MMILLVRELTRNLPPVAKIEFHGNRIRPNHAKAARLVTAGSDLSFTLREQFASNTLSTMLTKYPQVANAAHPGNP